MNPRYLSLAIALAGALGAMAENPQPEAVAIPPSDSIAAEVPAPALPAAVCTTDYVPSCLLDNPEIARRFAFTAPSMSPYIAAWSSGVVWGAGGAEHYPGMMGVESATLGVTQQFGRVSITAYGSAAKYAYFRGLSTQWSFGGSMTWQFADRLSLTLFGNYSTRAYAPGMSPGIAEMISRPSFGGYMSWDITDRFGVDVGVASQRNMMNHYEVRPIVAPYYRVGDAKISVDVGGIVYEAIRSHSGWGPHNPTVAPEKPVIPIAPRN